MRRFAVVLFGALLIAPVGDLPAQDPSPREEMVVQERPSVVEPSLQSSAPLPIRSVPERTLRPYWHVFAAFAITWVLLFGYALSLGRRLAGIEAEVSRLHGGGIPPQ